MAGGPIIHVLSYRLRIPKIAGGCKVRRMTGDDGTDHFIPPGWRDQGQDSVDGTVKTEGKRLGTMYAE